jgi:hypothetical protein
MGLRDSRNEDGFVLRESSSNITVVLASAGTAPEIEMPTIKYLTVVAAVLAAAFFLAQPETKLPANSYADVIPAAISALSVPSPKIWSDERYQAHTANHEELVSISRF